MTEKELRLAQLYTRVAKLSNNVMNGAIINKIKRKIRQLERTN
jgi:hypothetical protein